MHICMYVHLHYKYRKNLKLRPMPITTPKHLTLKSSVENERNVHGKRANVKIIKQNFKKLAIDTNRS